MEPITIALALAKLTGLDKKIGSWIGGDNGAEVASKVLDIAQGYTNTANPAEALAAIKASETLRFEFRTSLLNRETELKALAYKNTEDARAMQAKALEQDDNFSKRFIYVLAAFWSLFAVIYIGCITFITIPEASVRFADTILGFILGTVIATILNFFFGSSSGNERRSDKQDLKDVMKS